MKILGMEIPPKGKKNNSNIESAPVLPEALPGLWEKCEEYLGAREKFAQTLRNGTALDQVQALKKLQDTTKIYAGEYADKVMQDYANVFNSLQKVNKELHQAYSDMEDQIVDSKNYSNEEIEAYVQGDLSLLNKEGKPLFNPEEMAAIVEYNKDPANKEKKAKIVELVHGMGGTQKAQDYAKAAAVAGFFAMQGLAPTDLKANTLNSSNLQMEESVEFLGDPVTVSLSPEQFKKEVGRGNLAGSKTTPYYHKTNLKNLGISQAPSIDLETIKGKKVPLSTYTMAYANTQDKDGNYWAYDGFRNGQAWLVKLSYEELSKLSFVEYDGALYIEKVKNGSGEDNEACGNIWVPVVLENEEAPDNGQLDIQETPAKKIERENNLVAKRGLEKHWFLVNKRTNTKQLIGRWVEIETFNLDKYGGNSKAGMTELYLVKQVDENGDTYWKIVDGVADFNTYYEDNGLYDIEEARFTEGYNGLNGTSFTVPVSPDSKGTQREIELASELLGLDVRK